MQLCKGKTQWLGDKLGEPLGPQPLALSSALSLSLALGSLNPERRGKNHPFTQAAVIGWKEP